MVIALIAQDGTKYDLETLVKNNIEFFMKHEIVATNGTSKRLAPIGLDIVETVNGGIDGGDIQIAGMILNGEINLVIFLTNVKDNFPHWYDAHSLERVCVAENVPFAMNIATAERLIEGVL